MLTSTPNAVDDLTGSGDVHLSFEKIVIYLVHYLEIKRAGIHAVVNIRDHMALVGHIIFHFSEHRACKRARADKSEKDCQEHKGEYCQKQHFSAQAAFQNVFSFFFHEHFLIS